MANVIFESTEYGNTETRETNLDHALALLNSGFDRARILCPVWGTVLHTSEHNTESIWGEFGSDADDFQSDFDSRSSDFDASDFDEIFSV